MEYKIKYEGVYKDDRLFFKILSMTETLPLTEIREGPQAEDNI